MTPAMTNSSHGQNPVEGNTHVEAMPLLEKWKSFEPTSSSVRLGSPMTSACQKKIWTRSGTLRIVSM